MFELNYSEFVNSQFNSFNISYMPGLKVMQMDSAKCIINIDNKSAYIFI